MQVAVENNRGINQKGYGRPTILALSRQGVPNLPGTSKEGVAKGGYIVHGGDEKPDAIILATGEMSIVSWPLCATAVLGICLWTCVLKGVFCFSAELKHSSKLIIVAGLICNSLKALHGDAGTALLLCFGSAQIIGQQVVQDVAQFGRNNFAVLCCKLVLRACVREHHSRLYSGMFM